MPREETRAKGCSDVTVATLLRDQDLSVFTRPNTRALHILKTRRRALKTRASQNLISYTPL